MPANKNAMTRYKILDELLSDPHQHYSLDELTAEVNRQLSDLDPDTDGVVRRTIEKDIQYLECEGPFYVEIERYKAPSYNMEKQTNSWKRCLRYADESFSIFKKEMSQDEKAILREALSLLGQFDGLPNLEGLERLRQSLEVSDEERQIISFVKNPLENSTLLGELFTAISLRQAIDIQYHTFAAPDVPRTIRLHPYLLKEYNRRWYLIAAADSDKKLLNFSLDRIDRVTPLPSYPYEAYDGELNERFENIIGVTLHEERPVEEIYFWVDDTSKDFVATKPLHESQRNVSGEREAALRAEYPMLRGGRFFRIDCQENYELLRELMSFGEALVVVKPTEIRDKIAQKIAEMQKSYDLLGTRR